MARSKYQNGGRWIRAERRLAIYLRDGFECLVCAEPLMGRPGRATLDHVVPRSRGGTHHESNLFTCCRSCNSRRQQMPLRTFLRQYFGALMPVPLAGSMARITEAEIRRRRRRELGPYREQARELVQGEPSETRRGILPGRRLN